MSKVNLQQEILYKNIVALDLLKIHSFIIENKIWCNVYNIDLKNSDENQFTIKLITYNKKTSPLRKIVIRSEVEPAKFDEIINSSWRVDSIVQNKYSGLFKIKTYRPHSLVGIDCLIGRIVGLSLNCFLLILTALNFWYVSKYCAIQHVMKAVSTLNFECKIL